MYLYHVATAVVVFCYSLYHFFFVKQKTAYEMRISDWSSDVCSSDLDGSDNKTGKGASAPFLLARTDEYGAPAAGSERLRTFDPPPQGEGDQDRKSVVEGKRVTGCVDLGGRRIIQKKIKNTT